MLSHLLTTLGVSEAARYPSRWGGGLALPTGLRLVENQSFSEPGQPCLWPWDLGGARRKAHSEPKRAAFASLALTVQRVRFLVPYPPPLQRGAWLAAWSQAGSETLQ